MDASFFIRGLIIGLSIAAVVGPMSVLCIQRTLHKGQLYGLMVVSLNRWRQPAKEEIYPQVVTMDQQILGSHHHYLWHRCIFQCNIMKKLAHI